MPRKYNNPKMDKAAPGGWSDWVMPRMSGYRMACCDCGLVHEMDFQAVRLQEVEKEGEQILQGTPLPVAEYEVQFRVRRHNRATAQLRRARHGPPCLACGEPKPAAVTVNGGKKKHWQCRRCLCTWPQKPPARRK